jgi:hypothetical protein
MPLIYDIIIIIMLVICIFMESDTRSPQFQYAVVCRAVAMQWPQDRYSRAISRQWLSKHIPTSTDMNTTMVQQQKNGVFCVVSAEGL